MGLLSIVAAPFHSPTNSVQMSPNLHIFASTCYVCFDLFSNSNPNRYRVIYCDLIYFSLMIIPDSKIMFYSRFHTAFLKPTFTVSHFLKMDITKHPLLCFVMLTESQKHQDLGAGPAIYSQKDKSLPTPIILSWW